jgi:phenylacetic acid degradation operon negative regulatory protein
VSQTRPAAPDPVRGVDHGSSSSQAVLGALLVDYDFADAPPLSAADFVRVLAEFGVSEAGVRSALSRVTSRGLLQLVREGRSAKYRLSDEGRGYQAARLRAVTQFGADVFEWDGLWTFVLFSLPESRRADRQRLRAGLAELGLVPAGDGLWTSPWDRRPDVLELAERLDVGPTLVRGEASPVDALASALTPDTLRREFERFLSRYSRPSSDSPLVLRTNMLRDWRAITVRDPHAPAALLPHDWPRREAHDLFIRLREELAGPATARLRSLLGWRPDSGKELEPFTLA